VSRTIEEPGASERPGWIRFLDPVKVRQARIRQGWAERNLSGTLGVSTQVLVRLEHGANQRYLTLAFLNQLASILGVTIAELTYDPVAVPTQPTADTIESDDPATVGAVLAQTHSAVQLDTLATALIWTLPRVLLALDQLDTLLEPTGQRLCWHHDTHVQLANRPVADTTAAVVAASTLSENGPDLPEARLLAKLATTGPVHSHLESRFAVMRLSAAGFIDTSVITGDRPANDRGAEGARLTELARFNLVLD